VATTAKTAQGELKARLRAAGLRATPSRAAVLDALTATGAPMSHADVCDRLAQSEFDRATIYRNLTDLADAGLVRRHDLGDRLWRYELADRPHDEHADDDAHHPHFVCTACGGVECLPDGAIVVTPVKGAPRALKGGAIEIQVRGTCNACG
jgi:Fur family ferric uptake transcriptional regulator